MAAPDLAAQFHHRLVLAARAKLNDIETNLADRVNYWVVVNEVLGTTKAELKKLGQYEMERMALARHGDDPTDTGYTPYGCGLFAFANATPPTATLWKQGLTEGKDENKEKYCIQAVLKKANDDNLNHSSGPQHVLLLHQYFQPDNQPSTDPNHIRPEGVYNNGNLRPDNLENNVRRFEHHYLEGFKANYGNLKVIISEYGLDGRIGLSTTELGEFPSRGWKHFDEWSGTTVSQPGGTPKPGDGAPYLHALKALDRSNRGYSDKLHDGVILGYCIYGWGYNCSYQFWSYPLDETPDQDPKCDPPPTGVRDPEDTTDERRKATLTQGLVTYAEALRTQDENKTLPPQLRLNHDALRGGSLKMYGGPGTASDLIHTIPAKDSSWYDIVCRSDSAANIRSEWWQIEVYAVGPEERITTGWVNKDLVRFSSESNLAGVKKVTAGSSTASKPSVQSKANVVALVRKDPKDDADFVQPLQDSAEALGLFGLSPRWYQVQLGNGHRGWVRASQVTGRNTDSLEKKLPRLRRWPGGREAVPVRRGPGGHRRDRGHACSRQHGLARPAGPRRGLCRLVADPLRRSRGLGTQGLCPDPR